MFMMLSERQNLILKEIIEMYFEEQKPIGSINLSKKLDLASSTIRNELLLLDKEKLLINKNSLGREPSEISFRYYYNNFATEKDIKNINCIKFSYDKFKLAKIDLISLQPINDKKSILLIVFDNEIHITQLFDTTLFSNMEIANVNEILKKTFNKKRIPDIQIEDLKNRYSKKSSFELFYDIVNFLLTFDNYRINIIDNSLSEIEVNQDDISYIELLTDNLFIGFKEHNLEKFSKYTILKQEDFVYIFKIGVDYNAIKKIQSKNNETNNTIEQN